MAGSQNHNVSPTSYSPSDIPLIENHPNITTTTTETVLPTIGTTVGVKLLFSSNPIDALQVILTCRRLVSESVEAADPKQICAYYLSIILNLFPALEETVIADMREIGAVAVKKVIPVTGVKLETDAGPNECLIVVAQVIYLFYMNIIHEEYDDTMRNIIVTLKVRLGMDLRTEHLPAFSYEHAHLLMTVSESYIKLKEDVINQVISNHVGHGKLSKMCNYMCCVLAWNGMRSFLFMVGGLVSRDSPAFRNESFLVLIKNMSRNFNFMNRRQCPQYFGISKPGSMTRFIKPARFPTLYAVAERLWKEKYENTETRVSNMFADALVTDIENLRENSQIWSCRSAASLNSDRLALFCFSSFRKRYYNVT